MGILKVFFNNTRKPEGLLGRCMVDSMNHAHAALADWGLRHLPETGPAEIAELGCGGGRNIRALLRKYPVATVTALDYSKISVEKARSVNRKGLQAGRCRIIQGDVSHLPFENSAFDLVTAFETVYFWPGPTESFREVYRTLRPGGIFLIANESDGENSQDDKWLSVIDGMRIFNQIQLTTFLTEAGFSEVIVKRNTKKHWLCALAIRENTGHLGNK
ncbi:MAG TPA: class I SAM-dependent methyltransferase [Candidatus Avilachnospira avicola]|nr:class I SAM-dependent methyltransferase [Candidatus Avilachnospira avicola]